MRDYNFLITEDESVGLYNNSVSDIYHSKTGALKEALEKFVLPSFNFINFESINILDICYGIGYNTKAALLQKRNVNIDALEYDSKLVMLSPFVKDSIQDIDLKIFLFTELLKKFSLDEILNNLEEQIAISSDTFFAPDMLNLIRDISNAKYKNNHDINKNSFLHNIYYNYISNNTNNTIKVNKYARNNFNIEIGDARKNITKLDKKYDIVFLDAFSPQKDPSLWTIDFLAKIKEKMSTNSILTSYSKSTPFRSALLELGFNVGKTFLNNEDMGTIASLHHVNNELTDYDLKLISTRSGITYKDDSLASSKDEIITRRISEQKTSKRLSHTAFLKQML